MYTKHFPPAGAGGWLGWLSALFSGDNVVCSAEETVAESN